jgi:hypothetical protein
MPDLPDPTLCDHEFTFINVYDEDIIESLPNYGKFFCIFVCKKCGKIVRVWEES